MLAHTYNTVIERGVGAPGHGREVFGVLNSTEKKFSIYVNDNRSTAWYGRL